MADLEMVLETAIKVSGQKNLEKTLKEMNALGISAKSVQTTLTKLAKKGKSVEIGGGMQAINKIKALNRELSKLKKTNNDLYQIKSSQRRSYLSNLDVRGLDNSKLRLTKFKTFTNSRVKLSDNSDANTLTKRLEGTLKTGMFQVSTTKNFGKAEAQRLRAAIERRKFRESFQRELNAYDKKVSMDSAKRLDNGMNRELAELKRRADAAGKAINNLSKDTKNLGKTTDKVTTKTKKHRNALRGSIHEIARMRHEFHALMAVFGGYLVFDIGRRIADGFIEGSKKLLEFNDEVERSKTLFSNFFTTEIAKPRFQILADKNPAELAQVNMADKMSQNLTTLARRESVLTGRSFADVMDIFKQSIPDLRNRLGVKNSAEFAKQSGNIEKFLSQITELSSVMADLDGRNKKPSFYTFSLLEALTGSNGNGKKGVGSANFLSLLRRANIKLSNDEKGNITSLVNNKNPFGALDALEKALNRSGISRQKLQDLQNVGLMKNIDMLTNKVKFLGSLMSKPVFDKFLSFFKVLNNYLDDAIKYKPFTDFLKEMGDRIGEFVQGNYIEPFYKFLKNLETAKGQEGMRVMIERMIGFTKVMTKTVELIGSFAAGLFGLGDNEATVENTRAAFDKIAKAIEESKDNAYKLGENLRRAMDILLNFGNYDIGFKFNAEKGGFYLDINKINTNEKADRERIKKAYVNRQDLISQDPSEVPANVQMKMLIDSVLSGKGAFHAIYQINQMNVHANDPSELAANIKSGSQQYGPPVPADFNASGY